MTYFAGLFLCILVLLLAGIGKQVFGSRLRREIGSAEPEGKYPAHRMLASHRFLHPHSCIRYLYRFAVGIWFLAAITGLVVIVAAQRHWHDTLKLTPQTR